MSKSKKGAIATQPLRPLEREGNDMAMRKVFSEVFIVLSDKYTFTAQELKAFFACYNEVYRAAMRQEVDVHAQAVRFKRMGADVFPERSLYKPPVVRTLSDRRRFILAQEADAESQYWVYFLMAAEKMLNFYPADVSRFWRFKQTYDESYADGSISVEDVLQVIRDEFEIELNIVHYDDRNVEVSNEDSTVRTMPAPAWGKKDHNIGLSPVMPQLPRLAR